MSSIESMQDKLARLQDEVYTYAGERAVTIMAVTKYATLEQMVEAYDAGLRHFGENKVQDAFAKMEALPSEIAQNVEWHFIGQLQTNKISKTVGRFALIHSVASERKLAAISEANEKAGTTQDVLLQVNISGDPDRHGAKAGELPALLRSAGGLSGVRVQGLMGMAPFVDNPAMLKRAFCGLRDMRDALSEDTGSDLPELSMGMTNDFTHALQCGATMIRVGSYFFRKA